VRWTHHVYSPPSKPPGWYPDPWEQAEGRWWDGSRWTQDTRSAALPDPGRPLSKVSVAGFVFGLLSVFAYQIGILPILAVILSVIGLATHRSDERSGQWMAAVGLILGLLYTFMYLVYYGHIVLP